MTMPAEPPTKAPSAVPEKPAANKVNPYRPEMPQIPGVVPGSPRPSSALDTKRLLQIGPIAAIFLSIGIGIFWWVRSNQRRNAGLPAPPQEAVEPAAAVAPPPAPIAPAQDDPGAVATTEELSKPWASKKFVFVKPFTSEQVNAMVIRLPDGGLWAFSLQEPYGNCELEFVTDLGKLASQYGYRAAHPMIGNPCNGTVYDPLKVGPLGGDTWARGEIVKGSGLRPPISIDVKVSGHSIIADRIE
jgi:hypothetical protein